MVLAVSASVPFLSKVRLCRSNWLCFEEFCSLLRGLACCLPFFSVHSVGLLGRFSAKQSWATDGEPLSSPSVLARTRGLVCTLSLVQPVARKVKVIEHLFHNCLRMSSFPTEVSAQRFVATHETESNQPEHFPLDTISLPDAWPCWFLKGTSVKLRRTFFSSRRVRVELWVVERERDRLPG